MYLHTNIDLNFKKNNLYAENLANEFNNIVNNKKETFIIDRLENNFAVCENYITGKKVDIPTKNIPLVAKEGDILKKVMNTNLYKIEKNLTKNRLNSIKKKTKDLWE